MVIKLNNKKKNKINFIFLSCKQRCQVIWHDVLKYTKISTYKN